MAASLQAVLQNTTPLQFRHGMGAWVQAKQCQQLVSLCSLSRKLTKAFSTATSSPILMSLAATAYLPLLRANLICTASLSCGNRGLGVNGGPLSPSLVSPPSSPPGSSAFRNSLSI